MKPCQMWEGTILSTGYGQARIERGVGGRRMLAHRWVWTQANGPIPDGLIVMHTCDNPGCVEITHLRLGTQKENMADRDAKGHNFWANKTECINGHPYNEENTYWRKDRPGQRQCRACNNEQRSGKSVADSGD